MDFAEKIKMLAKKAKESEEIFLDKKDKAKEWKELCGLYDQAEELFELFL